MSPTDDIQSPGIHPQWIYDLTGERDDGVAEPCWRGCHLLGSVRKFELVQRQVISLQNKKQRLNLLRDRGLN